MAFTVWTNDAFGRCGRGFVRPDKAWPLRAPAWQTELEGVMLIVVSHGGRREGMFVRPGLGGRNGQRLCAKDKTAAPRSSRLRMSFSPAVLLARVTPAPSPLAALFSPPRPRPTTPWCLISAKCVNRCLISAICVRRTRIWPDSSTKTRIWRESGTRRFQKPLQWMPSMPSSSFQSATRASRSARARLNETLRSGRPMSRRAFAMTPSM